MPNNGMDIVDSSCIPIKYFKQKDIYKQVNSFETRWCEVECVGREIFLQSLRIKVMYL